MITEDKQLLLRDLCARLPYGVKVCARFNTGNCYIANVTAISADGDYIQIRQNDLHSYTNSSIEDIRPYLRPIKSMTQEECDELFKILNIDENNGDWLKINDIGVIRLFTKLGKDFYEVADAINYLYSIHVDFRGMIEKSLALEAPEGMYKND